MECEGEEEEEDYVIQGSPPRRDDYAEVYEGGIAEAIDAHVPTMTNTNSTLPTSPSAPSMWTPHPLKIAKTVSQWHQVNSVQRVQRVTTTSDYTEHNDYDEVYDPDAAQKIQREEEVRKVGSKQEEEGKGLNEDGAKLDTKDEQSQPRRRSWLPFVFDRQAMATARRPSTEEEPTNVQEVGKNEEDSAAMQGTNYPWKIMSARSATIDAKPSEADETVEKPPGLFAKMFGKRAPLTTTSEDPVAPDAEEIRVEDQVQKPVQKVDSGMLCDDGMPQEEQEVNKDQDSVVNENQVSWFPFWRNTATAINQPTNTEVIAENAEVKPSSVHDFSTGPSIDGEIETLVEQEEDNITRVDGEMIEEMEGEGWMDSRDGPYFRPNYEMLNSILYGLPETTTEDAWRLVDLPQHQNKWQLTSDSDGIQVYYSKDDSSLVMAHLGLPKLSAHVAMDVMTHVERRHMWDPVFVETRCVDRLGELQKLIYLATAIPPTRRGPTPKDDKKNYAFCQKCTELRDLIPDKGVPASIIHMLVYEDAKHLYRIKPKGNTVLADTLFSGYIIQDDPEDMDSSIMLRLINVNLKEGYTASEAALKFCETAPVWREALLNEGKRYQKELEKVEAQAIASLQTWNPLTRIARALYRL